MARTRLQLIGAGWVLCLAMAAYASIEVESSIGPMGGVLNGQKVRVGASGVLFEHMALVLPQESASDPNAVEALASKIGLAAGSTVSGSLGIVNYRVTNNSSSETLAVRLVIYVDVDIDRFGKPTNDEFAVSSGTLETASTFEVGDLTNGNLLARVLAGALNGTVTPTLGSTGDVIMAFSFDDTLAPQGSKIYQLSLSEQPRSPFSTSFAIEQRDTLLPTVVTVTAARTADGCGGGVVFSLVVPVIVVARKRWRHLRAHPAQAVS